MEMYSGECYNLDWSLLVTENVIVSSSVLGIRTDLIKTLIFIPSLLAD